MTEESNSDDDDHDEEEECLERDDVWGMVDVDISQTIDVDELAQATQIMFVLTLNGCGKDCPSDDDSG